MKAGHSTANPSAPLTPFVGKIVISLTCSGSGEITEVGIENSRPKDPGRLLVGKTKQQVLEMIPRLFLLCSQAQLTAATFAFSRLSGTPLTDKAADDLSIRCALEWLKEHSWQLWQMERELFGEDFAMNESLALSRYLIVTIQKLQNQKRISSPLPDPDAEQTNASEQANNSDLMAISKLMTPLFGCSPEAFCRFSWDELNEWIQTEAPYARLFHTLAGSEVATLGSHSNWQPELEDGSLIRQKAHPLMISAMKKWGCGVASRTLSRLIEMAEVCRNPGTTIDRKKGIAFASRGRLTHTVSQSSDSKVKEYRIDAPTDRYFAPGGLVEQSLMGQIIPFNDTKWIRQLIWSIDPCVEFMVETHQQKDKEN